MKNPFSSLYWNIRNRIFPQNNNIRKVIPRNFVDVDGIIDAVLIACLFDWADKEDGLFPKLADLERDKNKHMQLEMLRANKSQEEVNKKVVDDLVAYFEINWGGENAFIKMFDREYDSYLRFREAYYWFLRGKREAEEKWDKMMEECRRLYPTGKKFVGFQAFMDSPEFQSANKYSDWIDKETDKHLTSIFELRRWMWT